MKYLILIVLISSVLFSCNNSKTTGIALSTTTLFGSETGSDKISLLPTGTKVVYGGDGSPASVAGKRVKVSVNGTDGYIDKEDVIFNGTAAVMRTAIENREAEIYIPQNGFVVYDSSAGNKVHVYHWTTSESQWVDASNVDPDTVNVAVAAMIDALESGQCTDADARAMLRRVAIAHSTHPLLGLVKVDLSEASDETISQIEKKFSDLLIDKSKNEIISSKESISGWASSYTNDILALPPDDQEPDEFNRPRLKYFYNYVCALPSFVKLAAKSMAFTWGVPPESDSLKSYLLYRLDRSPENIKALYDAFKPAIAEALASGLKQDVIPDIKGLIAAYDRIVAMPNHRAMLTRISGEISNWDRDHTDKNTGVNDGAYTLFNQASIYQPIIDTQKYDVSNDVRGIWYASFWTRRFAEGNEKVVYEILKDLSTIEHQPQQAGTGADDESNETELITCTFQDYTAGDCGHILFSCGDYGDADISELTKEEQALWLDLALDDETNGPHGNPEYVGKRFSIRIGTTTGPACNEGQGGEGTVPRILELKLLD
jgi:hypothetical protein